MTDDVVTVTAGEYWTDDVADTEEGVVTNWFVNEGTNVSADELLGEIQIEKVTIDIHAPTDGTIVKLAVAEGDAFEQTSTLFQIDPAS